MAAVKEAKESSGEKVTKHILEQYSDALARIQLLRRSVANMEYKLTQMNKKGYYVTDSVTRGKKGRKTLGTVTIEGFPVDRYKRLMRNLGKRRGKLLTEEQELLELVTKVEEYIAGIENIEIRNILSLYYVDNLTWVQVAHEMNTVYKNKNYTESSCRQKHDYFLKKK